MRHTAGPRWLRRDQDAESPRAAARPTARRRVSPRTKERLTRLVVDVGHRADAWRDAADEAQRAFTHWQTASAEERRPAGAAYLAAIDREEKAATQYRSSWRDCCVTAPDF